MFFSLFFFVEFYFIVNLTNSIFR